MSSFKISARTILQLGAELISSDDIAFYELVKNAVDARSPRVEIDIISRITHLNYVSLKNEIGNEKDSRELELWKESIKAKLIEGSPKLDSLKNKIDSADSLDSLRKIIDKANYIKIRDFGYGMSLKDLEDIYLTIGTRNRYLEKKNQSEIENNRPLLGDKGIGRLSVMRLGNYLLVKTSEEGEKNWNTLEIDWDWFSHDSSKYLEEIQIAPKIGKIKEDINLSGTTIYISALNSDWNLSRVKELAKVSFNRFTDPFDSKNNYPIEIYFNNDPVPLPEFDKSVFKFAHATVEANLNIKTDAQDESAVSAFLNGKVNYRLRETQKFFNIQLSELESLIKPYSIDLLISLGPFSMKAYWYNRPLISEKLGVPDAKRIKRIINEWAGGLMLYRDGFRVFPYGGPDDDWLRLDKDALAAQGYKVNRRQIIGKVDITSAKNPKLTDQTNREGLRNSDEKDLFVKILQFILRNQMRAFLTNIDDQLRTEKAINFEIIEGRFRSEIQSAYRNVNEIAEKVEDKDSIKQETIQLKKSFELLQKSMEEAINLAEHYKQGAETSAHLAANGLLIEMLAHELNRASKNVLDILPLAYNKDISLDLRSHLKSLEAEMKTLEKRLRILDPLGTAARQRKETFDMVEWVKEIFLGHQAQFKRHNIKYEIKVVPQGEEWKIKAYKGMIVQVIENLISNSIYWLKHEAEIRSSRFDKLNIGSDKTYSPKILVILDKENQEIRFSDNGHGISLDLKEEIFLPFVTYRTDSTSRGLGLYIAREIANFHDAKIFLSNKPAFHSNRLDTFVFNLAGKENDED